MHTGRRQLTLGTLGLAATLASESVFAAFLSDDPDKAFMHGPTYMANPLACAAANASIDLFEREPRLRQVEALESALRHGLEACRALAGVVDVRVKGAIGVVQIDASRMQAAELRRRFTDRGCWIRPFGDIVYLTPPFTIGEAELATLMRAVYEVLEMFFKESR